jgi:hypothetical protein
MLQGQRDQSVTFGFREGISSLDIRRSTEELENSQRVIQREVYVRRPTSRTSNNSDDSSLTPTQSQAPSGPFCHTNFRMIDASTCDLRDPIDRNRKDSITSSVIMNEQYRQQQQSRGNRSRHSSITSTSTMRSDRRQQGAGMAYAIETSFCGAKPIKDPNTIGLSSHQSENENDSPPTDTKHQSEESLTGKLMFCFAFGGVKVTRYSLLLSKNATYSAPNPAKLFFCSHILLH